MSTKKSLKDFRCLKRKKFISTFSELLEHDYNHYLV